jgi:PAS domain S-box-containing protein
MKDDHKTKAQLLSELAELRQRIAELETTEAERKRMEGTLRLEEHLRLQGAALEAAANGIVITNRDGAILWTNRAFTTLTGYAADEAMGQNPRILKSGVHGPAFYQALWQTIQSGQVWHNEIMNRRKDGSLYIEEMTITPVPSTDGEITHFVAIKQDVTERKWTENKLQETKDQLETILQGVADGINVLDATGRLIYVNEAAAHAAGYPSAQAMLQAHDTGQLFERFDILDESGQPFPIAQLPNRLALQGKRTQAITLCYRLRSTGEEKWSVVQATPILDEDGQVRFVVTIARDITDRRRAEEAMATLASFPELNPSPIVEVDLSGQVHYLNAAAQQLLPGLQTAGPQHPWLADWESIADQFRQGTPSVLREVPIGGLWYQQALYYTMPGRRVRIYGLDITERRQAREALQEKTDELDRFFSLALDLLCIADTDGYFRRLNRSWETTLGYRLETLEGKRFLDLVHPDDLASTVTAIADLAAGKSVLNFVNRYRCQDGSYRWIEWHSSPYKGKLIYAAARDITKRKEAEETLARHDRAMAALYETSLEINSQPDVPTLLHAIVRRAVELLGTRMGGLYLIRPDGQTLEFVVTHNLPRDYTGTILHLGEGLSGRIAQTGKPMMVDDHLHWDGRAGVYADMQTRRVLGVPLKVGGRVIGVINVADNEKVGPFDENQVRLLSLFADQAAVAVKNARLVEALRHSNAELEARNGELDAFAHTVAHDLKNPVGLIIGFAEILAQGYATMSNEDRQQSVQLMLRNGRKISDIIDELLLLAEVRKVQVKEEPLDMERIVAEALQRLADMVKQYQADIRLPSTWTAALGYAPWVEEVWMNYLSNAIKYGGHPPRIELGAAPLPSPPPQAGESVRGGMVRFWVRDNGAGLTPEDQAQLFAPFTRLDQVRVKGHGLGLSIVRRIVEKLGGQVGVESQVGHGSMFSFTLPGVPG